jgi:hypothetical protein
LKSLPHTQHLSSSIYHLFTGTLLAQGQRAMPGGNQLPHGLMDMLAKATATNQQLSKPIEHRVVD